MEIDTILHSLREHPQDVEFDAVIAAIDDHYHFEPTAFINGDLHNAVGQNNGSCKIFSFARLHDLDEQQTLHCFGRYYRDEVLHDPDGDSHQNIRNFMRSGWRGIRFVSDALKPV